MPDTASYKLPETATPERYEIRLTPDLTHFTFTGEETISITVHEATPTLVLNACELTIQQVSLADETGASQAGSPTLDEPNERAVLEFPQAISPGRYALRLAFAGSLNDKLKGFYRSSYKDATGNDKTLATTQFESTDARRAFPCWDEPAAKAVFQATLVIDAGLTAISNTAVVSEDPIPGTGKKAVVFADTIKMSTYLVAFIVGEFEASEAVHIEGTPLRVWAVPGKRHLTPFGRAIGAASLQFFSDYYGRPYPGDKLDLIAIPDFAAGAMENLGAITFRETALLIDEQTAARSELERVADVVAHENAHMWFGDLVTMRWWNGLWLNEAFATFMEMMAVDAWKPAWQRWTSFAVSRAAALQVDGLRSSRPIEFPVENPDEAQGMFDILTYEKGAAILRMLEQYLGPQAFQKGISHYLGKHEYDNAETTDLWDALEEATQQPVRAMMDSWVFQAGYPLISVALDGAELVISQQPFHYVQNGNRQAEDKRWQTPVFIKTKSAAETESQTALLTTGALRLPCSERPDWVVVNAGGHGFYRVRYTPDLLGQLTTDVHTQLSPIERFNLLNDTWATAQAGLTPLSTYLDLLPVFREESDHNVWATILGSCHYLYRLLGPEQRPALERHVRALLTSLSQQLGWAPQAEEDALIGQLRGELLSALGTLGADPATQAQARALYTQYRADQNAVDRNLVPALVSILAHTGDAATYDEFRQISHNAATPQEEQRYQFALAGFRQPDLFAQTLDMTLNGEVRTQNAPYLMRSLLMNIEGRELAWRFLQERWDDMLEKFPDVSIVRMCEGIVALVTPELEAQVNAFFTDHPVPQAGKMMAQHLEKLHVAVACQQREAENLREYFERAG